MRRRLRHVGFVKRLRSRVACVSGGVLVAASAAFALPAVAAEVEAPTAGPPPQRLVVAAAAPLAATPRDAYTVTARPPLQYPVAPGIGVASGYGPRTCANCASNFHHGVDVFPGAGTPIAAMASGVVSKASHGSSGAMGVMLEIQHVIDGQPVTSVYGHLQAGSLALTVGDAVEVGQVVGLVGATGNAAGAHLHFEIRPGGGASVNPYGWLAARIG